MPYHIGTGTRKLPTRDEQDAARKRQREERERKVQQMIAHYAADVAAGRFEDGDDE